MEEIESVEEVKLEDARKVKDELEEDIVDDIEEFEKFGITVKLLEAEALVKVEITTQCQSILPESSRGDAQVVELELAISEEKSVDVERVDVDAIDVLVLVEFNDCEAELICDELDATVDIADDEGVDTGIGLAVVVDAVMVSALPVAATAVESAKTV